MAQYIYDAWGRPIFIQDGDGKDVSGDPSHIANRNPLRYRGYFYGQETGFYYLQSRYYAPVLCRFINADSFASTGQGFLGYNMFIYCYNRPTYYLDNGGNAPIPIDANDKIEMEELAGIYEAATGNQYWAPKDSCLFVTYSVDVERDIVHENDSGFCAENADWITVVGLMATLVGAFAQGVPIVGIIGWATTGEGVVGMAKNDEILDASGGLDKYTVTYNYYYYGGA